VALDFYRRIAHMYLTAHVLHLFVLLSNVPCREHAPGQTCKVNTLLAYVVVSDISVLVGKRRLALRAAHTMRHASEQRTNQFDRQAPDATAVEHIHVSYSA